MQRTQIPIVHPLYSTFFFRGWFQKRSGPNGKGENTEVYCASNDDCLGVWNDLDAEIPGDMPCYLSEWWQYPCYKGRRWACSRSVGGAFLVRQPRFERATRSLATFVRLLRSFRSLAPQRSASLRWLCSLAPFTGSLTHFAHSLVGQLNL